MKENMILVLYKLFKNIRKIESYQIYLIKAT